MILSVEVEVVVYTLLPTHTVLTPYLFQVVYPHIAICFNDSHIKKE